LLGVAVLSAFQFALHCGFVSFDDPDYVTSNPIVQQGLTRSGLKWAFTTGHACNWHPLTWISHMADCQLYGIKPLGHHLSSVLIHAVNAILLFLLLNRLTGAMWSSACVAALFALHPLRVESVVWVSERKDVLSTFFWLLAAGAYVRYAEKLKSAGSKFFYALAIVFFAFGLMAKPMVVTLPFVLLLLDYWPLGRLQFGPAFSWGAVAEKAPFFLLAAGDSVVTFLVQDRFGAVANLSVLPLGARLANAPVACVNYIVKDVWPTGLAVFYPHRALAPLAIAGSVCLLAAISAWVLWRGRSRPYLAVGWCWFLGMLIPTLGLVQAGYQSMADRYTYLPCVGLWIMAAWSARDWVASHPRLRVAAVIGAEAAIAACFVLTLFQARYWHDTRTLFVHDIEVTGPNYMACYSLGRNSMEMGQNDRAIDYFKDALRSGQDDGLSVSRALAYNDLGYIYLQQGQISNAMSNFGLAITANPLFPQAHFNMGRAFAANNQPDMAVDCFQRTAALDPNAAEVHNKLAAALAQSGQPAKAIAEYSRTLQLNPGLVDAANNLAWLLATCPDRSLRDGPRAVELARQASERSGRQNPTVLGTLAAAYAETGRLPDAVAAAREARQLALSQNNSALAATLASQLRRYQELAGDSNP
jgi:tetratricopeptide (TPR) repeat protein